jgi:hypothetical protein
MKTVKFVTTWIDKENNLYTKIKTGKTKASDKELSDSEPSDIHAARDIIHQIVKDGGYVKSLRKYEGNEEGLAGA